jgi:hypothetical protein
VRSQIRNVLYREKRTEAFQSFVEELKKEFGVTTFPERLADVKVEQGAMPSAPPQGGGHAGHGGHPHGLGAQDGPPAGAGAPPSGAPPTGDPR